MLSFNTTSVEPSFNVASPEYTQYMYEAIGVSGSFYGFLKILGPVTLLFVLVFYFFLKHTYYERLIARFDEEQNAKNLHPRPLNTLHLTYKQWLQNLLVQQSFKILGLIFFFFSIINILLLYFVQYYYAGFCIYGFFSIFYSMYFTNLFVGIFMMFFFFFAYIYSLKQTLLNYELPFLYAFGIIILLLTLYTRHLLLLFVLLEIFSYTAYILVTVKKINTTDGIKNNPLAIESGIKYFILGSLSSFILIFGLVLFLISGTNLSFISVSFFLNSELLPEQFGVFSFAFLCIIMYFFFKLSLFPFHWWIAETFIGTSILTIFYISVPVKLIVIFLFMHIMLFVFSFFIKLLFFAVLIFVPFSLFIGTLGMYFTTNVKSFLAFSTIYNMSYLLIGVSCFNTELGLASIFIYLSGYLISMLLFFFIVISIYSNSDKDNNILYLNQFSAIKKINFFYNIGLIIVFLSMLGMPPFAGFWGKFYILILLFFKYRESIFLKNDWVCDTAIAALQAKAEISKIDAVETPMAFIASSFPEYPGFFADFIEAPAFTLDLFSRKAHFVDNLIIFNIFVIIITSIICSFIYLRILKTLIFDISLNDLKKHFINLHSLFRNIIIILSLIIIFFFLLVPFLYNFSSTYFTIPFGVEDFSGSEESAELLEEFLEQLRREQK